MKSQTLYFSEGRSDKFYTASIDASGVVQFAWGRRGGPAQTKTVGPLTVADAEKLYASKLAEKVAKGYTPGDAATPLETVGFTAPAPPAPGKLLQMPNAAPLSIPKPMLLNEIADAELLALAPSADWYFQEKHDGNRILLVKRGKTLTSFSRSGRETRELPKPVVAAAMACDGDFILDGELMGDLVWGFDLLDLDGDLRALPYSERLTRLQMLFPHSKAGIVVTYTASQPDTKLALFGRMRSEGGEGIVLKLATAKYEAGRPNKGGPALKYKFVATASVIVASHNTQSSFNMKLFDGTELGRCTVAGCEKPPVGSVAEIRYLNVQRGGHLYQSVFLGVREDIEPSECVIEQLKFKGEAR